MSSVVVSSEIVKRSYVFGDHKGRFFESPITTLESACVAIAKHHKQDPKFFKAQLRDGVYIVTEKDAVIPDSTFPQWKDSMLLEHPTYKFSPNSYVTSSFPYSLIHLLVPGTIFSPFIAGKFYYAMPSEYERVKVATNVDFLYETLQTLSSFIGIEKIQCAGLYGFQMKYGFTPAAFVFKENATCSFDDLIATFKKGKLSTEQIDKCHQILLMSKLEKLNGEQILQVNDIIHKNHPDLVNVETIDFDAISSTTVQEIRSFLDHVEAPCPPPAKKLKGPKSFEELKELAKKTKENADAAIVAMRDELRRSAKKCVDSDHIRPADYAAEYTIPK